MPDEPERQWTTYFEPGPDMVRYAESKGLLTWIAAFAMIVVVLAIVVVIVVATQ